MSPSTSFAGIDQPRQPVAVDVLGRRELEQDPGHARVAVELGEQRLDLVLRRVGGQPVVEALHADLVGRLLLAADVDRGGGVLPDQHRREPGRLVAGRDPRGDLGGHLAADLLGDRLAVDDLRAHSGAGIYPLRSRSRGPRRSSVRSHGPRRPSRSSARASARRVSSMPGPARRLGRERQRPAAHHLQPRALGVEPVEQVEPDARAEAAGADAEPGEADDVDGAPAERACPTARRSGCTCRSRRPSGARSAGPRAAGTWRRSARRAARTSRGAGRARARRARRSRRPRRSRPRGSGGRRSGGSSGTGW